MENDLTRGIIGAAIEVHRHLGPGLLESAYEECLCYELNQAGICYRRQLSRPLRYKGISLENGYRVDLLIENSIVVKIKSNDGLEPVHSAQLLTYLKLLSKHLGLLINFNVPVLKNGIKRVINGYLEPPPCLGVSVSNPNPRLSNPAPETH